MDMFLDNLHRSFRGYSIVGTGGYYTPDQMHVVVIAYKDI
jgi:hypothetical protein